MRILKHVDILATLNRGKKKIYAGCNTIITPLARETADINGIEIAEEKMRKPLIAGNWKMNKTVEETATTLEKLKGLIEGTADVEVMIAPSFISIKTAVDTVAGSNIEIGAQNMYFEDSGAYTGEISPGMLCDAGCKWVIIGHSERRQYFGCTDEMVNRKLKKAVAAGLKPVICVGETLEERESEKTFDVLRKQLAGGLKDLSVEEQDAIAIAYEPIWAIGTGKTATPQIAEEAHAFIRNEIVSLYSEGLAEKIRILYGGSVKPDNVISLMEQENIDGGIVGGASLESEIFSQIVKYKG
jgi:triosephosphate isomerase